MHTQPKHFHFGMPTDESPTKSPRLSTDDTLPPSTRSNVSASSISPVAEEPEGSQVTTEQGHSAQPGHAQRLVSRLSNDSDVDDSEGTIITPLNLQTPTSYGSLALPSPSSSLQM